MILLRGFVLGGALLVAGCSVFGPPESWPTGPGGKVSGKGAAVTAPVEPRLNAFPKTTLLDFNKTQRKALNRRLTSTDVQMDSNRPSAAVEAAYLNRFRPVTKAHQAFLKKYADEADDEEVLALYREEVQVLEGDKHYWLPAQKEVLEYLKTDLKNGDVASFKVRHLGFQGKEGVLIVIDYDRAKVASSRKSTP